MKRLLLTLALAAALLPISGTASRRADRANHIQALRCHFAYVLIHADGKATDRELAWLGSLQCWDDGTSVIVYGP